MAEPDNLAAFRSGRLGPAVQQPGITDPSRLLAAVADALNQCERHGVIVDLEHGAALTSRGYVLAVGDPRLGHRWAVRTRLETGGKRDDDPGPIEIGKAW